LSCVAINTPLGITVVQFQQNDQVVDRGLNGMQKGPTNGPNFRPTTPFGSTRKATDAQQKWIPVVIDRLQLAAKWDKNIVLYCFFYYTKILFYK